MLKLVPDCSAGWRKISLIVAMQAAAAVGFYLEFSHAATLHAIEALCNKMPGDVRVCMAPFIIKQHATAMDLGLKMAVGFVLSFFIWYFVLLWLGHWVARKKP